MELESESVLATLIDQGDSPNDGKQAGQVIDDYAHSDSAAYDYLCGAHDQQSLRVYLPLVSVVAF
ncbi:MAG: hypothetical protein ACKOX4_08645, partial [Bacteroidota bacterium]